MMGLLAYVWLTVRTGSHDGITCIRMVDCAHKKS